MPIEKPLKKLASPATIADRSEREQVSAVRNEIGKRAESGDAEAMHIMNEIHEREEVVKEGGAPTAITVEGAPSLAPTAPEVEVRVEHVEAPEKTGEAPKVDLQKKEVKKHAPDADSGEAKESLEEEGEEEDKSKDDEDKEKQAADEEVGGDKKKKKRKSRRKKKE